jgi:GT2 family glycosyltransferase
MDLSVIIPFKNTAEMTLSSVFSIAELNLKEIILVNNNSDTKEMDKINGAVKNFSNVKILDYPHAFNFQKINNFAVSHSSGNVIWCLNNYVELPERGAKLVEEMYNKAQEPDVGAVGCVLVYEDQKTIQHAGVYLVPGGTAAHLYTHHLLSEVAKSDELSESLPYNVVDDLELSAVTAASLMVERSKFDQINGFNEDFIINGGDVDLCLRLGRNDYHNWLLGLKIGTMIHKESQSVKFVKTPYSDFSNSYNSYIKSFDSEFGDKFIDVRRLKEVN